MKEDSNNPRTTERATERPPSAFESQERIALVARRPQITFAYLDGALALRSIALATLTTIGRDPHANVELGDRQVSRKHARIESTPLGGFQIVDCSSANGTFLNGQRIQSALLAPGDVIRIGRSLFVFDEPDPMAAVRASGDARARSNLPLLITGESGVGKEHEARRIHEASGRGHKPFVGINCAVHEATGDADLFGHVQAAFTGADRGRIGLLASARGGTVFLDELEALPPAFQTKLLTVIETNKIRKLGQDVETTLDVRFLAATNKDLKKLIREGQFRADLYERFAKPPLALPPLRERRASLPALIDEIAREIGMDPPQPCVRTLEILMLHRWEGNVRELKHLLETVKTAGPSRTLDVEFVKEYAEGAREIASRMDVPRPPPSRVTLSERAGVADNREHRDLERERTSGQFEIAPPSSRRSSVTFAAFESALESTLGNVSEAAKKLGIERRHVYRLLERYQLSADQFRASSGKKAPAQSGSIPRVGAEESSEAASKLDESEARGR